MTASKKLERAVLEALKKRADPKKAPQMKAYMKSEMDYLGVQSKPMREAAKEVFLAHPLKSEEDWRDTCLSIWQGAKYREQRYVVLELTGHRPYRAFWNLKAMPMYEELITTGAWWDYVDVIASNRVGPLLEKHPKPMKKKMLAWSKSKDMWKARTSIICQLRFKANTDLDLLYAAIERSIDSKEFFLRKAIGWALREYAKTDPDEVVRFVEENEDRLSGLSKREALKNVTK